ncbi:hypothetical protein O7599_23480 [Streptomyces sp. WMMC500]|uniref:hypothetical protein n=1 Tax=Streptomyces sp. WMMC500 TaxID=3015154 RepID=UPI00248C1DCE|nr:hypothetical protein [Streptomyces sp. WMMC500]WBB58577.1 hypothetical protein O7599_23480 [Streptomyces sp. WMMC500]
MTTAPATTAFSRARGLRGGPRGRRAAVALGAVVLPALALSGCEKPTPLAQITVGDRTASAEAQCYDDGENIPEAEIETCVSERAESSITADVGDRVRIGVEPDIADDGWVLFVDGRLVKPQPSKHTYVTYLGEQFFSAQSQPGQIPELNDKAKIGIVEIDDEGNYKGAWSFDLKRKDA